MRYLEIFIIVLLGFNTTNLIGQTPIENDKFKFWQPGTRLVSEDYKSDTTKWFNSLNRKCGMQAYSYCMLSSILDVPKKKRERGKKLEKVYLAPRIDKYQSVSITRDSFEMAKQQVFFDITELFARIARREFKNLQDSLGHVYGIYWSMYSTVISDICERKTKMYDAYMGDVILYKKEGAYEKWRKLVDKLLLELKDYATKSEDCIRLMNDKPLTDDYIISPNYLGEIKCNKE